MDRETKGETMTNFRKVKGLAAAAAVAVTMTGGFALRADDLPKAETILDRFIAATGGKANYEKRKSEIETGTLEISAMGIKGSLTRYAQAPNKTYSVIEIEGIGKIEEGSSDGIAWQKSLMTGAHVKTGVEKAQALREATFNQTLHWHELFAKAETTGVETVNGEECYKVVLTPKEGKPESNFYSKKSGLLVKSVATVESQNGEMEAESSASDYKDFGDGILSPSKMTQKAGPQEITITISSVKVNEAIPADKFEVPADIKALAAKP
jgi:zinc protease